MSVSNDITEILFSKEELQAIVKGLGEQITNDYKDKNLLLVGILKGSVVFMSDLIRAIDLPCKIDFMEVSSYGNSVKSSGRVRVIKDLSTDIQNMDVLIVEDILESGTTLAFLKKFLLARKPKSFKICTLFDKPSGRVINDVVADYVGANAPNSFIVGYGLDYAQKYRNLPYIGVLKPELYSK